MAMLSAFNSSYGALCFKALDEVFSYLDPKDRSMSALVNLKWSQGATIPLYIRLEGYYALNFRKLPKLLHSIKDKEDAFSKKWVETIQKSTKSDTAQIEFQIKMWSQFPKDANAQRLLSNAKMAMVAAIALTQKYGCDPYIIQNHVDQVLGIPTGVSSFEDPLRESSFDLMTQSKFLIAKSSRLKEVQYDPGYVASKYMDNEHFKTLIIGCGVAVKTLPTSCYYGFADEPDKNPKAHENALYLSMESYIGPHIISDMHDRRFWKAVPDERFDAILDHTRGNFVFENEKSSQTLKEMHRALKPDGYLKLDADITPEYEAMLKSSGFKKVDAKTTKAFKTFQTES